MDTYLEILSLCGVADDDNTATVLIREMISAMLKEWQKDVVEIEEILKKNFLSSAKIGEVEEEGKLRKVLQFEEGDSEDDAEIVVNQEVDSQEDVDDADFDMFG